VADDRIQFDMQHIPQGVVPTLRELAAQRGLTVGVYCRVVLIEHALQNSPAKK
jgi:hypothetical protein